MSQARSRPDPRQIDLPEVTLDRHRSLERALGTRRSVRAFDDLAAGVWHCEIGCWRLLQMVPGERRPSLARAALGQSWLAEAPAVLAIAAVFERTTRRYGTRGERYVHIEVGHAAQNTCLMATVLGLGTTVVGAFDDRAVAEALALPAEQRPLALVPVGHPARPG